VARVAARAAALLLALLAATSALAAAPAGPAPTLVISATPRLEPLARALRALDPATFTPSLELLGLATPGPPIVVELVGEEDPAARGVPPWVAGYALPATSRVVLLAERSPPYPDRRLEVVLRHEVAHVLIARAAGGRPLPRWFDEGLALAASRETVFEDRSRLVLGAARRGEPSLARLDAAFRGDPRAVADAYAEARALVRFLLRAHPGAGAELLAAVAAGEDFAVAFARTRGETLAGFVERYHRERPWWLRVVPWLSHPGWLALLLSGLAAAAFVARRRRDRRRHQQWEEEELLAQARYRARRDEEDASPDETIH
jgi:hypothetical protein